MQIEHDWTIRGTIDTSSIQVNEEGAVTIGMITVKDTGEMREFATALVQMAKMLEDTQRIPQIKAVEMQAACGGQ